MFQHTAARRRLASRLDRFRYRRQVSTHSRPKAAGEVSRYRGFANKGFNTQPPEGGWLYKNGFVDMSFYVSTHSRPKAAGATTDGHASIKRFQHTAARRRLGLYIDPFV